MRFLFYWLTGCLFLISNGYAEDFRLTTQKPFADVVQDIEYAIQAQNFRITSENHIGQAIRERGNAQFPLATIIHFCNLQYAETLLILEPDLLLNMPCRIAIYEDKQQVIISTPQLPATDNPTLKPLIIEINHILQTIVQTGAE
ncbi:hypothetical protein BegalDRAFT_1676 [Beggiatoa alba B18LD]|uniref:DUF302 domain-containing protein n=1 Tax=Beggiatoa alba B18LD TaxID=395493 RepID=I3CG11_9GAMM|nr:DUF302 domain-containing protein [Beggiatoa alba]EIJ42554.1 hypothetical protein BegalDRAFT_1676 [Beggiatoa alba B18LD]